MTDKAEKDFPEIRVSKIASRVQNNADHLYDIANALTRVGMHEIGTEIREIANHLQRSVLDLQDCSGELVTKTVKDAAAATDNLFLGALAVAAYSKQNP